VNTDLHPEARGELYLVAIWYAQARAVHGDAIIAEIDAALDRIRDAPESHARLSGIQSPRPIHKIALQRFPYVMVFERHERGVSVLLIARARRRTGTWFSRAAAVRVLKP
jgi:hypothetical protein